ncbi:MAG: SDR family oxidoreductase [Hoeflea sp.]|uniref:SDR family oxidoreductase n=1 Tax=Hoeflea sp. TaxID=1940281 RepID=UPI001D4478ED|nr:SDR family oxidoreductase [Hoeflea sp.]MBU4530078.1 SDR family oxidoreductase [Alphaproteobacteria bacterium]MBU4542637.1 SDR family oxidoreductase [Alphaproteobacteria bacterium]MBU4551318.1 SDR family oxidoreductase [Alphaproteobacteria bacterium]MBV1723141.1 SDR family oxidoreductase [Hoeflea sp.]MBV1760152.1 SDR family oxidoreductase [Hoeflea sp.]
MRLDGKTIIITGASSGIGAAAAELFAAEGANLVLGARREAELAHLAGKIGETGRKAIWLAGDIAHQGYHKALVDLSTSAFGGLDGAFNNAGTTGDMGPIPDMTTETWDMVIATNLTGGFLAARHQIPAMRLRGGGSIVFTSSFVGHTIGLPGMGAYAASKAGLIGLVQVLAAEHGAEGIRANALLPGGTRTAMAGEDAAFHDWVKGLHALKRMAEPEEIARAALFLVSDESSFVTGSAMMADGGNSINKT